MFPTLSKLQQKIWCFVFFNLTINKPSLLIIVGLLIQTLSVTEWILSLSIVQLSYLEFLSPFSVCILTFIRNILIHILTLLNLHKPNFNHFNLVKIRLYYFMVLDRWRLDLVFTNSVLPGGGIVHYCTLALWWKCLMFTWFVPKELGCYFSENVPVETPVLTVVFSNQFSQYTTTVWARKTFHNIVTEPHCRKVVLLQHNFLLFSRP